ncbi:beta-ketoacyl-[acyl-carrier-protein] synthase family protein [Aegicerativicinus sediminis]
MSKTDKNSPDIKVGIIGLGIISAIGNSVGENTKSLFNLTTGIGKISHLNSKHSKTFPAGEINLSNEQLIEKLNLPKVNNYSRTALLGLYAAKEAIINADLSADELTETALISSTTVGGMDMTEKYLKRFATDNSVQNYLLSHKAADSTNKIAKELGIMGFSTTISTACSSSANAVMLGAKLIKSGKVKRAIVGGTDALSKFTINGFNSLKILSEEPCAPFDDNRKGLNLGEGAAYIVLEATTQDNLSDRQLLGYVSGYGNANDAYHQTASSENGDGAFLAMRAALKEAQLKATDIDYVNAHGTATQNNDLSESIALLRLFDKNVPNFSSTKSLTGHTLAAAGAIEAVFCILALNKQIAPGNLNFLHPITETKLNPIVKGIPAAITNILSNSFGFGGNCTSLIFSKA